MLHSFILYEHVALKKTKGRCLHINQNGTLLTKHIQINKNVNSNEQKYVMYHCVQRHFRIWRVLLNAGKTFCGDAVRQTLVQPSYFAFVKVNLLGLERKFYSAPCAYLWILAIFFYLSNFQS